MNLKEQLRNTKEYNAIKFDKLSKWARKLPEPYVTEFFNILANGSINANDNSYMDKVYFDLKLTIDKLESEKKYRVKKNNTRNEKNDCRVN